MVRSKVRILSEELKGLKKELKNTAAREQRAKERLSDSLQKLKEQNFINAELHLKLEAYEGQLKLNINNLDY
jgi:predicted Zn-dependent peptidase